MKRILYAVLGLFCGLTLTACVVVVDDDLDLSEPDKADLARSIELGNNILAAFRDEDYACLTRNVPGPLRSKLTEKDFKTSCAKWRDTLGKIRDYEYVLELDTPAVRNLIWKVGFGRDAADGGEVEQDMLFRLVTGEVDDETCVLSCGFL